jgi:CBS domain-containing protein
MTRDVITVTPQSPYREIVDRLVADKVSAVPVVEPYGRVGGVVSEADLLHKVEAVGEARDRRVVLRMPRHSNAKSQGVTAAELMTAPPVTVWPATSVVAAARRLEAKKVKRMPVVDDDGCLVGIVSRRDLLRMHTRPDRDVRDDIVDGVLVRTLWIDPLSVEVDVVDGVATVTGKLESRSLARLLVELAGEVAGVVEVVDRLT